MLRTTSPRPVARRSRRGQILLLASLLLVGSYAGAQTGADTPRPPRLAFPSTQAEFGFTASTPVAGTVTPSAFRSATGEIIMARGLADGTVQVARFNGATMAVAPDFTITLNSSGGSTFDAGSNAAPALADLDNDGAPELVVGNALGTLEARRLSFPAGEAVASVDAGLSGLVTGIDVGDDAAPALADLDGDGDLDLLCINSVGAIGVARNGGTPANANPFTIQATLARTDYNALMTSVQYPYKLAAADVDGDGKAEAVVGDGGGNLYIAKNNTPNAASSILLTVRGASFRAVPANAAPALVDLDGDSDMDLAVGNSVGVITAVKNLPSELSAPSYTAYRTHPAPSNFAALHGNELTPSLLDVEGDGDLDLFFGTADGTLGFARADSAAGTAPEFTYTIAASFAAPITIGSAAVAAGDVLGTGPKGVLIGDSTGAIRLNPFTIDTNSFTIDTLGSVLGTNPFDGQFFGANSAPALCDIDDDGDLDVFIGSATVDLRQGLPFYLNQGADPSLAQGGISPITAYLTSQSVMSSATIARSASFADIDNDGDEDALLTIQGETSPRFLENVGTASSASFYLHDAIPTGVTTGSTPACAAGDIDGDGVVDALVYTSGGATTVLASDGFRVPMLAGDSVTTLPLGDGASIAVDITGCAGAGTLKVSRRVGIDGSSLPPASFVHEYYAIDGTGMPAFTSADLTFKPSPSNGNGLLGSINRVRQVDGPTTTVHPNAGLGTTVTDSGTEVTVTGVTGFSDWYLGFEPASVSDWMNH